MGLHLKNTLILQWRVRNYGVAVNRESLVMPGEIGENLRASADIFLEKGQRKTATKIGIPVLDPCYYFRLRLALMRMGTGFGALLKNKIKLPRMQSPKGKIQFVAIDI